MPPQDVASSLICLFGKSIRKINAGQRKQQKQSLPYITRSFVLLVSREGSLLNAVHFALFSPRTVKKVFWRWSRKGDHFYNFAFLTQPLKTSTDQRKDTQHTGSQLECRGPGFQDGNKPGVRPVVQWLVVCRNEKCFQSISCWTDGSLSTATIWRWWLKIQLTWLCLLVIWGLSESHTKLPRDMLGMQSKRLQFRPVAGSWSHILEHPISFYRREVEILQNNIHRMV